MKLSLVSPAAEYELVVEHRTAKTGNAKVRLVFRIFYYRHSFLGLLFVPVFASAQVLMANLSAFITDSSRYYSSISLNKKTAEVGLAHEPCPLRQNHVII
jgi:hypothetical protein